MPYRAPRTTSPHRTGSVVGSSSGARRAFTMIELIVVIVVLGLLAGIGMVAYNAVVSRAQDAAAQTSLKQLGREAQALSAYRADGVLTAEDLTAAATDVTAPGTGAAAWKLSLADYGSAGTGNDPADVHGRFGPASFKLGDKSSSVSGALAGVARTDSATGRCTLARVPVTGEIVAWTAGPLGASCNGDVALAGPAAKPEYTDPADAGPPAAPTGLVATRSSTANTANLAWNANTEPDIASYRVLADGVQVASVTGPSATLTNFAAGDRQITVIAVDKSGLQSAPSSPATAVVNPADPTALTVTGSTSSAVTLSWTGSPDAAGYVLSRNGNVLATLPGGATTATDSSVSAAAGYTYSVTAYAGGGQSLSSNVVGAAAGSAYGTAVLAQDPVGYWKLDETTGATVTSIAASAAGATRTNGTVTGTPRWGQPGAFAGTRTALGANSATASLPLGGAITGDVATVSFWMRPDSVPTAGMMPIALGSNDLYLQGGNIGFNTGASDLRGVSSAGLIGKWTHVVAQFSASNPTSNKLWLDGRAQTLTQVQSSPVVRPFDGTLSVSSWASAPDYRFVGAIDEVAIFDGALTDAQVTAQYRADGTSYADTVARSAPVGFWRLGDTGTTAVDSSGWGRNGIHSGTVSARADGAVASNGTSSTYGAGSTRLPTAGLTPGGVVTVEMWLRPTANADMMPVSMGTTSGGSITALYDLFWWSGGQFGFNTGNGDNFNTPTSRVPMNGWTHVVAEFRAGSPQASKLWINGQAQALVTNGNTPLNANAIINTDIILGAAVDGTGYRWQGGIDEVAVYSRTLSQTEVQGHWIARNR